MPQEIRVVKCFKCLTFQVDIVKKAKKWECKMCGEKQSVMQEFGRGSGAQCRKLVQELNMKKHEFEQMAQDVVQKIINEEIEVPDFLLQSASDRVEDGIRHDTVMECDHSKASKWEAYVEKNDSESDSDDNINRFQSCPPNTTSKQRKRIFKRKSTHPPEILPENIGEHSVAPILSNASPQKTSQFFNLNKKSKFEFNKNPEVSKEKLPTKSSPVVTIQSKPKTINPNSKWGNFLDNSDVEE